MTASGNSTSKLLDGTPDLRLQLIILGDLICPKKPAESKKLHCLLGPLWSDHSVSKQLGAQGQDLNMQEGGRNTEYKAFPTSNGEIEDQ